MSLSYCCHEDEGASSSHGFPVSNDQLQLQLQLARLEIFLKLNFKLQQRSAILVKKQENL